MTPLDQRLTRPIVAVLRAADGQRLVEVAGVLLRAGIPAVEVTLTTPGALEAVHELRRTFRGPRSQHVLIGAGTVRTADDVHRAADAGAQFVVSQLTTAAVLSAARQRALPAVAGALTPNEIAVAHSLSGSVVKISPIGPVGGVAYLRELVGPLPEVPLFPTGGVTLEDAPAYLDAGAAIIGVSAHLLLDALTPAGDLSALHDRATALVAAVDHRPSAA